MADNTTLDAGAGGDAIVTREIAHAGDTAKLPGCFVMAISGSEGAYTAAAVGGDAANGLDVDVTRLPALPAGDNNIGNVDVVTSALPTGAATAANQATGNAALAAIQTAAELIDNAVSGNELQVDVVAALPAGNNNIGDVDVASIAAGANLIGDVGLQPRTAGGLSMHRTISAATTNATSVKASAGQVYALEVFNVNAAARYLKLYDKASAPTVGTDVPVKTLAIPGNTAGAGFVLAWPQGIAFSTGIAFALTTGVGDADATAVAASEIVVNLDYK